MLRSLRFLLPFVALAPALFAEVPKPAAPPQLTFLRSQESPDKLSALQTLSAEYKPASGAGPTVWLIGVAHLGTKDYYSAIQKRLDAQSAVLYEGVGGDKLKEGAKLESEGGIQGQLAKALGLVFQLDAINYQRPHFINSDFTAEDLEKAMGNRNKPDPAGVAKNGDKPADSKKSDDSADKPVAGDPPKIDNQTFNSLMDALHGEGQMAESLGAVVGLMGSSPEMQETTKLMLVQALGQAGDFIDMAKAMSPDIKDLFEVLITERNAEVIRNLREQINKLGKGKTVAVFYGAAHMDEIAQRLTSELNYTLATKEWDTAFSANGAKSIMPPAQIKLMLEMVRMQMKNPPPAGSPDASGGLPFLNLFGPQPGAPAPK